MAWTGLGSEEVGNPRSRGKLLPLLSCGAQGRTGLHSLCPWRPRDHGCLKTPQWVLEDAPGAASLGPLPGQEGGLSSGRGQHSGQSGGALLFLLDPASLKSGCKGQGTGVFLGGHGLSEEKEELGEEHKLKRECLGGQGVWGQRQGGVRESRQPPGQVLGPGLGRPGFSPRC